MVLIDTSAWIHFLRRDGAEEVRRRVEGVLLQGTAAWCPVVRLELWNGARGEREKAALRRMEETLPELSMDPEVWSAAFDLARRARAGGLTIPATDLLIAACARAHGAELEHADSDFDALAALRAE